MFVFQVLVRENPNAFSIWNVGVDKMYEKIGKDPEASKIFARWEKIGGNFMGAMIGGEKGEQLSKDFRFAKVESKDEDKFNAVYNGFKNDSKFMESVYLSYGKKISEVCEKYRISIPESEINKVAAIFTEQTILFTAYSLVYASGMGVNSESAMRSMNTSFDLFDLFVNRAAKNKQIAVLGMENLILSGLLKLDDVSKEDVLGIIEKNKMSIKEIKKKFNNSFARNNEDLANRLETRIMPSILHSFGASGAAYGKATEASFTMSNIDYLLRQKLVKEEQENREETYKRIKKNRKK